MLKTFRYLLALIAMTITLGSGLAWAEDGTPPTDVEIQTKLQALYAAPKQGMDGSTYDEVAITWTTMKRGKPHLGNAFADGTPANTNTTVFPVLAEYVVHRTAIKDRTQTVHTLKGQYGFFRNEFDEWQFSSYSHDQIK